MYVWFREKIAGYLQYILMFILLLSFLSNLNQSLSEYDKLGDQHENNRNLNQTLFINLTDVNSVDRIFAFQDQTNFIEDTKDSLFLFVKWIKNLQFSNTLTKIYRFYLFFRSIQTACYSSYFGLFEGIFSFF